MFQETSRDLNGYKSTWPRAAHCSMAFVAPQEDSVIEGFLEV